MSKEAMKFDNNAVNLFKNVYGVSGGGVTPVDVLPERGAVGTIYQTPDGNLYYWAVKSHKGIIPPTSLEVGNTYTLRDSIPYEEFYNSFYNIFVDPQTEAPWGAQFTVDLDTPIMHGLNELYIGCIIGGEVGLNHGVVAFEPNEQPEEPVGVSIDSIFENGHSSTVRLTAEGVGEPPYEVTITQELVTKFDEAAQGSCTLNDFAFLFVGEETVVIDKECYIQLSGIYIDYDALYDGSRAIIYDDTEGYNAQIIYDTMMAGGNAIIKYTVKGSTLYEPLYYFYLQPQLFGGEIMILVSNYNQANVMIAAGFDSGAKNSLDFGKASSRDDSPKEKEEIVEKEPTKE